MNVASLLTDDSQNKHFFCTTVTGDIVNLTATSGRESYLNQQQLYNQL